MKTLFSIAAVAFALCIAGSPQRATAQWPPATSHEPAVTIEFGGIAFDREGLSDSLVVATDSATGATLLTGDEATDLGSAAGVQGKIVFPSRRTLHTFELRGSYTGWDEDFIVANSNLESAFVLGGIVQVAELAGIDVNNPMNPLLPPGITAADLAVPNIPLATGTVSALSLVMPRLPDGLFVDRLAGPDIEDFFDVRELSSKYQSDYTSIELMSRRNHRPGLTWLCGPRFISISEDSEITTLGTSPTRIFLPPSTTPLPTGTLDATAAVRSETRNSMIGLQLGLEYNMPITQDVYIQVSGRGGAFYNSMHVGRSASPLLPTIATNATDFTAQINDSDSGEAWLAEVSIRGYVDLIPNSVAAYAGFDAVYIDQVALAPAQSVVLTGIENSGELYARGLSFGLKMNY